MPAVIRNLVLGTLVAILPFSGMRMICIDAPAAGARAATTEAAADDCERICARRHVSSDTNGTNCVLTADACASMAFATTIAVGTERPTARFSLDVSAAPVNVLERCAEPELARHLPPPKRQVLHHAHNFLQEDFAHECGLSLARATALV